MREMSSVLYDIQGDIEEIPNAPIGKIDDIVCGTKGLDARIGELAGKLAELAEEEIEDGGRGAGKERAG